MINLCLGPSQEKEPRRNSIEELDESTTPVLSTHISILNTEAAQTKSNIEFYPSICHMDEVGNTQSNKENKSPIAPPLMPRLHLKAHF